MAAELHDPPEAPEGGGLMKGTDLVNKVCLFRPTGMGEWPARAAVAATAESAAQKARGPQPYVNCDVWVLDRAGIVEEGTDVRVGWWKAVEQLKDSMGQFVGAKPTKEEGSNAIFLLALSGDARKAAVKAIAEIEAAAPFEPPAGDDGFDDDPGETF
jgi:hypothetical protein